MKLFHTRKLLFISLIFLLTLISMLSLQEIEKSVSSLNDAKKKSFRDWVIKYENETWDTELESDIKLGKLKALGENALKKYKEGRTILM